MITEDEVTRVLKRADPARLDTRAPVVDAAGYLADLRTRSTRVTLTDTQPTSTSPIGRHRWPIIALAAAAVVAFVVGLLVVAARDDSAPPVPADTTAAPTPSTQPDALETTVAPATTDAVAPDAAAGDESIVRGYLDAYNSGDADAVLTQLSDDLVAAKYGSVDELRRELAWNEAAGWKLTLNNCERRGEVADGGVTFACATDLRAFGSEELGLGPFPQGAMLLTVRDGQIVAEDEEDTVDDGFQTEVWAPFARWIKAEHPADVPVMYIDEEASWWQTTDEAIALWAARVDEYVPFVLEARRSYPADVAVICAGQAQQLSVLDQSAASNTAAAAILKDSHRQLTALSKPPATAVVAYSDFYGKLIRLVHSLEDGAEADYAEVRGTVSTPPAGSGLEDCVSSLPS